MKRSADVPAAKEPEEASENEEDESSDEGLDDDSCPEVSDELEDDDNEDEDAYKEINVDFEFFDPKEIDFLGLKSLLTSYLDGQQYDCSGLVDTIINQTSVGTVIKCSNDDDPLAITTALNTHTHRAAAFMPQIRAFIASKCKGDAKEQILKAFDSEGTGLILNERLINSPPSLAPPLTQFLFEEIEGAAEDEDDSQEVRAEFQFQRYILMTRIFTDPDGAPDSSAAGGASGSGGQPAKKNKRAKAAAASAAAMPLLVYVRPEDEFLHQQATCSSTFAVENRSTAHDELQPLRLVMLVEASKVPLARQKMEAVIPNMNATKA
ncbi:MAG: hypothetical protein WDW38_008407 [Sanguina aurantia]